MPLWDADCGSPTTIVEPQVMLTCMWEILRYGTVIVERCTIMHYSRLTAAVSSVCDFHAGHFAVVAQIHGPP